jgi:hypothetical protein
LSLPRCWSLRGAFIWRMNQGGLVSDELLYRYDFGEGRRWPSWSRRHAQYVHILAGRSVDTRGPDRCRSSTKLGCFLSACWVMRTMWASMRSKRRERGNVGQLSSGLHPLVTHQRSLQSRSYVESYAQDSELASSRH